MLSGFGYGGKKVMVTGGTGALGRAVIELLVREGAHCVVPCVLEAELNNFQFRRHPQVSVHFPVELSDAEQVRQLYWDLEGLWASIHIAGGFAMGAFLEAKVADLQAQLDMNLRTAFLCCHEAAKRMPKGGRLLNIAARPALRPEQGAGMVPYAVSKAGVAAMTQSLAAELSSKGILVNAIAPSTLDTPSNRAGMPDAEHDRWVPLDAAAELIAYLASPANRAVTGAIVPIYARA